MRGRGCVRFCCAGIFSPTLMLGALVGRLFWILVEYIDASNPVVVDVYGNATTVDASETTVRYLGGEYAVIGAAALAGSVTRAVSTVRVMHRGTQVVSRSGVGLLVCAAVSSSVWGMFGGLLSHTLHQ